MRVLFRISLFLSLAISFLTLAQTTGKIAGVAKDTKGDLLPGVNISIEGTNRGASTNINGYFVILNVPPGNYTLKATMIGYATSTIKDVRVNIDQTTNINITLAEKAVEGQEIVVVAEQPIVQKDVSSSRVNLNVEEVQNLPVVSASAVIGLQAGVQGLTVRGGGSDQTAFMVNGLVLRDERDNTPYTGISFTSIDEIQIQTGGFNAEFGNIRSGLINVVTKEGNTDKFTFSLISRYKAASKKHFGMDPHEPNSYWVRPFVDPDVAFVGTKNGTWDYFTQLQYPAFDGWNAIAAKTLQDDDPTNDLTPEAAQQLWLFQHRKQLSITKPDYDIDMSFGGYIPSISNKVGNLRYILSYRQTVEQLMIPMFTEDYKDWSVLGKITSDITPNMKLTVDYLQSRTNGTNNNNAGAPGVLRDPQYQAYLLSFNANYIDTRMFSTDYYAPTQIDRSNYGFKFTHVLNPTTFYEATISRFHSEYLTAPGRYRDTSRIYKFGNYYYVDEGPYGFQPAPSNGIGGMRMGVGMSNSRDSSKVTTYSGRFDIQSQIDRYNNLKAGLEFVYTNNEVNYGNIDIFLPSGRTWSKWNTKPVKGALYLQDKLEFEGMIANIGVRFDLSDPGGEWYEYGLYDKAFAPSDPPINFDTLLKKIPTETKFMVSPRLGVAFPITENSKLFFNYGHFRQMPTPENLFLIRRYTDNNQVVRIANPNNELPRTIAYELGFEQNLLDQYLLRVAGYYKDISYQPYLVSYISLDGKVQYSVSQPNSYEDIRGFEITLTKNRGNWIQGFLNYTYMVSTAGHFGYSTYYENAQQQRQNEKITSANYQAKPVPQPYARANVDLFTPLNFGPALGPFRPLEDWRLSILANWNSGEWFTWTGGASIPGIEYNVQWKDYWNVDLRLSKNIKFGSVNLQFFVDLTNAFNFKFMNRYAGQVSGCLNTEDYNNYMKSLHLPADITDPLGYPAVPGDDKPGDYRLSGEYTPIVAVKTLASVVSPFTTAIYYETTTGRFAQKVGTEWIDVDQGRMDEINKNKSYIDMPNLDYITFLNPRNIYWGLKLSLEF